MEELDIYSAVEKTIRELNQNSANLKQNPRLIADSLNSKPESRGIFTLTPPNQKDYDTVIFTLSTRQNLVTEESKLQDFVGCLKEHYGLTIATGISAYGTIPVDKRSNGYKVLGNASEHTNKISHYGHKFFPKAKLSGTSSLGKASFKTFRTLRIFGIIGRVNPFVAVGLAVFDIISIASCMSKK